MATYGQVRFQLTTRFPGVPQDVVDSFLTERYVQILDRLDWNRSKKQSTISTADGTKDYALPADCRIIDQITHPDAGELDLVSVTWIQAQDPDGSAAGIPRKYAIIWDSAGAMQIRLWPTPDEAENLPLDYTAEAPSLSGTAVTLLPFVRPRAMLQGATSDILDWQKDYTGSQIAEGKFEKAVTDMLRTECFNRPAQQMKMADRFTRHRKGTAGTIVSVTSPDSLPANLVVADPTSGTVDGANATFGWAKYPQIVFVNRVIVNESEISRGGLFVVFKPGFVPAPGDAVSAAVQS